MEVLNLNNEEASDQNKGSNTNNQNWPESEESSMIYSMSSTGNSDADNNVLIIDSSTESPKKKNTINDFEIPYVLGKGSFGKVVLAKNIYTNKYYALKIIDKEFLAKQNKEYEVHIEKLIMSNLNHKNIIRLFSTFQDAKKLYFILEYCPNRDLADLIRTQGKLKIDLVKYYTAEIVSALEYMHKKGIYHRDLKPENILLDEKMHLKICDFGTANIKGMYFDRRQRKFVSAEDHNKIETSDSEDEDEKYHLHNLTSHLVGTAEYVSPEVISCNANEVGPPVDLWALGCIIYFALHGKTPFKDKTNKQIFDRILSLNYKMDCEVDADARDLISKLLTLDPYKRPGAGEKGSGNDYRALKLHPFLKDINWEKLAETDPPIDLGKVVRPSIQIMKKENGAETSLSNLQRPNILSQEIINERLINRKNSSSIGVSPFKFSQTNEDHEEEEKSTLLLEATVQKKSPWFHYNTRLLHLHSDAKMEYFDKEHMLKGTIALDSSCKALLVDDFRFDVVTKKRRYIFKLSSKTAKCWVDTINQIIESPYL